jgi:hypothetical protein
MNTTKASCTALSTKNKNQGMGQSSGAYYNQDDTQHATFKFNRLASLKTEKLFKTAFSTAAADDDAPGC